MTSLTERLRVLVRADARVCHECGHMDRPLREMASQLGVGHATLWRFLSGRATSERVINKLYERYRGRLESQERQ